jgi:hypothetical protein
MRQGLAFSKIEPFDPSTGSGTESKIIDLKTEYYLSEQDAYGYD